jgi:hypothetical protein
VESRCLLYAHRGRGVFRLQVLNFMNFVAEDRPRSAVPGA